MLKQYLSLLLSKFYSKQESGEVAKQSYPSTAATTIQLTPSDGVTNKEMSYTPPSDGERSRPPSKILLSYFRTICRGSSPWRQHSL